MVDDKTPLVVCALSVALCVLGACENSSECETSADCPIGETCRAAIGICLSESTTTSGTQGDIGGVAGRVHNEKCFGDGLSGYYDPQQIFLWGTLTPGSGCNEAVCQLDEPDVFDAYGPCDGYVDDRFAITSDGRIVLPPGTYADGFFAIFDDPYVYDYDPDSHRCRKDRDLTFSLETISASPCGSYVHSYVLDPSNDDPIYRCKSNDQEWYRAGGELVFSTESSYEELLLLGLDGDKLIYHDGRSSWNAPPEEGRLLIVNDDDEVWPIDVESIFDDPYVLTYRTKGWGFWVVVGDGDDLVNAKLLYGEFGEATKVVGEYANGVDKLSYGVLDGEGDLYGFPGYSSDTVITFHLDSGGSLTTYTEQGAEDTADNPLEDYVELHVVGELGSGW